MIPAKYKAAHYLCNRFKPLHVVIEWFEREQVIYSDDDILELYQYFIKKLEKDLITIAVIGDNFNNRERTIFNIADVLRYCRNSQQKIIGERMETNYYK